jgi:hypothetical protein
VPPFGPIKRQDLVFWLRRAGLKGPYDGGNHQYMMKGTQRVIFPNPHRGEISKAFLSRILRQAGVSREEWEKL